QPIIVGSVYNAENMPPHDLPQHKTRSGIKTRSTPLDTRPGPDDLPHDRAPGEHFNEIRFEDKKGAEVLYIHAERNRHDVVEANETVSVGHDRSETVGHDETIVIGNNRTETVKQGDEKVTIEKGNRTVTVHGTDEHVIEKGARRVLIKTGVDYLTVE